jgi:hypothetical protein
MPRKKRKPNHDMARPLEAIRSRTGLRLTKFRERLLEGGEYEVSYQAVQNYHFDRPAPIDYLARVAEVFGADFTYLATGTHTVAETSSLPTSARTTHEYIDLLGIASDLERKTQNKEFPKELEGMVSDLRRQTQHMELRAEARTRLNQLPDGARFLLDELDSVAIEIRRRAGHLNLYQLIDMWNPDDPERDMEGQIQDFLALRGELDDVFANTWEAMRDIVACEFGAESVERLTFEQQIRFTNAMALALSCLFPDHGDPSEFRERRATKEEES